MSAVEAPARPRLRPETVERATGQFVALGVSLAIAMALGSILIVLYGENPLAMGGYRVKSADGSHILICPIRSEVPVEHREFAALGDPADRPTVVA